MEMFSKMEPEESTFGEQRWAGYLRTVADTLLLRCLGTRKTSPSLYLHCGTVSLATEITAFSFPSPECPVSGEPCSLDV